MVSSRARIWPAATVAVALVAIAGCGSGGQSATGTAAPRSSASEAGRSLPNGLASAVSALRARIARSGCPSGQIAVSTGEGGAGLGHVGLTLLFHNPGRSACLLAGYPTAVFVAPGGRQARARSTPSGYLGGLTTPAAALPVVRVAPGATVSASLEGLDADPAPGGGRCPAYSRLLVTAPNQSLTFRLLSPLSEICRPEVHPVVPGTSGRGG